jgi:hypothetical protein
MNRLDNLANPTRMRPPSSNLDRRMISRPKILLTDTNRWPTAARMAVALQRLGCDVGVVCRTPRHPAQKASSVARVFNYRGRAPVESLMRAITQFGPDLIVPCCDLSVQNLHQLHQSSSAANGELVRIAELIEMSLGAPEGFPVTSSRFDLLTLAQSEGILVPEFAAANNEPELRRWSAQCALPWVMKADVTSGGQGIQFVKTVPEAIRFLHSYSQRPTITELTKRLILNRDWDWIISKWSHSQRPIIAQSTINGRPANCAVFCWQGNVLAGVAVEVIKSNGATGPATLVQIVEGAEMISAAERIARRLGISGFFGLDFVIEEGSGATYLIEMNPRCTPPCSLELGSGRNLVAALCNQLTGRPIHESLPAIEQEVIAYFPEVEKGAGTMDGTGRDEPVYHDIPYGEPELMRELLSPWPQRTIAGQLLDRFRRGRRNQTQAIVVFKDAGTRVVKSTLKHGDSNSLPLWGSNDHAPSTGSFEPAPETVASFSPPLNKADYRQVA